MANLSLHTVLYQEYFPPSWSHYCCGDWNLETIHQETRNSDGIGKFVKELVLILNKTILCKRHLRLNRKHSNKKETLNMYKDD